MRKISILFCFIICMQNLFAQTQSIDVFLQKLSTEKDDNRRIFFIIDFLAKLRLTRCWI
jgi:hypothetical protein